ncbi:hypothetical protein OG897_40565 [Streptomyces sp. NBC_00237]|uniref:hypothetical protein n=1 Tax=Streptomyces sp. NBC_00237 TaxID=2975687 RepID=UPI002259882F|nr:hypothetical protein [Streptomyces sp. NBC_00237]MCX5207678.1 hypothetical protein [Streptomyces sp. NBC_00237]
MQAPTFPFPPENTRVTLCWEETKTTAVRRWKVTASWRGHRYFVALHKGTWTITRERPPTGKTPTQWPKGDQVRRPDRRPIQSRAEAEALMIARVHDRRAHEDHVRAIIQAAADRPAPKWTPARTTKPRTVPRTDRTPADILAAWGPLVTHHQTD